MPLIFTHTKQALSMTLFKSLVGNVFKPINTRGEGRCERGVDLRRS